MVPVFPSFLCSAFPTQPWTVGKWTFLDAGLFFLAWLLLRAFVHPGWWPGVECRALVRTGCQEGPEAQAEALD